MRKIMKILAKLVKEPMEKSHWLKRMENFMQSNRLKKRS